MTITILAHDDCWKGFRPTVQRAAAATLTQLSSLRKRGSSVIEVGQGGKVDSRLRGNDKISITFVLTNDAEVKELNRDYRGKNKPTNVLSFPDGSIEDGVRLLGDVALAYETIVREASAQAKPFKAHLTHLVIHGTLHLLGYDHETDKEAEDMEALEIEILARMGIANPYETA
jgi:probable rRNA maturation factor